MQADQSQLTLCAVNEMYGHQPLLEAAVSFWKGDDLCKTSSHQVAAGGFKLWECSLDLSAHLCKAFDIRATQERWSSALPRGTRVLELGCGHGLPGILLLLAGCTVHFQASIFACTQQLLYGCKRHCLTTAAHALQDYNAEVLQSLTAVNVSKNLESHPGIENVRDERPHYFAGTLY